MCERRNRHQYNNTIGKIGQFNTPLSAKDIYLDKFNKETCFLNYLLVVYNKYL